MKKILIFILFSFNIAFINAQGVSINEDSSNPDESAILDVKSTDKGILFPRMTSSERDVIFNPVEGLIIFNITTHCLNYYYGSNWYSICGSITITPCLHSISLYDTYGDGWNGGNLNVYVNGILVLNNITLSSGSGPATFTFEADTNSNIQIAYTSGNWAYECYYDVIDGNGNLLVNDWYPDDNGAWIGTANCD